MTAAKHVKPGDKVAVPWGLGELVGTALVVYGPSVHRSVLVRVPVHGPSGETLEESELSFPESAVRVVAA